MSKELTPLEALEYLKENKRRHWLENDKSNECLDIIETALKEYKRMTYLCNGCIQHSETYYKEKKALEIIIKHDLIIDDLLSCLKEEHAYWDYHWAFGNWTQDLTQEEYDLLKEVLL